MVFMISVLSAISASPALNPLVGGLLNCLCRFRDSRCFRENHRVAKHRFGKPEV